MRSSVREKFVRDNFVRQDLQIKINVNKTFALTQINEFAVQFRAALRSNDINWGLFFGLGQVASPCPLVLFVVVNTAATVYHTKQQYHCNCFQHHT